MDSIIAVIVFSLIFGGLRGLMIRLLLFWSGIGYCATGKIWLGIFLWLLWVGWTVVRILILLNYI